MFEVNHGFLKMEPNKGTKSIVVQEQALRVLFRKNRHIVAPGGRDISIDFSGALLGGCFSGRLAPGSTFKTMFNLKNTKAMKHLLSANLLLEMSTRELEIIQMCLTEQKNRVETHLTYVEKESPMHTHWKKTLDSIEYVLSEVNTIIKNLPF